MDNMENSSYHNDIIKGFDFNREDFKSPAKRNLMIGAEEADYVILADENVTSEEEIRQIITENDFLLDYGMAIFGENVQDGEIDFNNIIDYFKMNVYGVVIKKSILVYTGCYNEELTAGIDYELAVRVAYYAEKYNYNYFHRKQAHQTYRKQIMQRVHQTYRKQIMQRVHQTYRKRIM